MLQLQQLDQELKRHDIKVAVVTFEMNVIAENYVRSTGWEWSFLVDERSTLYRAYGMERGKWWDLSGPAVIWKYFQLFAKGRTLKKVTGDVKQLGGNVIIDPDGILRYIYVGRGPADRPEPEELIKVVEDAK